MFILRYKKGTILPYGSKSYDVGGKYVRHSWGYGPSEYGLATDDLQKAKIYNTRTGAAHNSDYDLCEIVEVKIDLV